MGAAPRWILDVLGVMPDAARLGVPFVTIHSSPNSGLSEQQRYMYRAQHRCRPRRSDPHFSTVSLSARCASKRKRRSTASTRTSSAVVGCLTIAPPRELFTETRTHGTVSVTRHLRVLYHV